MFPDFRPRSENRLAMRSHLLLWGCGGAVPLEIFLEPDQEACQITQSTRNLAGSVLEADQPHLGYYTSGTSILSPSFMHV